MSSENINFEREPEGLITEVQAEEYLEALRNASENSGKHASLERSEFFRHKKDYQIFEELVADKVNKQDNKPLRFLEIGIGNMEEPISYLAAAYSKLDGVKLEDVIDMEIVEIRKGIKPMYRLGKQLFEKDKPHEPKLYRESFVLVGDEYEPNQEIQDYLTGILKDESRTHFGTPVENFTKTNGKKYDVVSCNNVIQHMGGIDGYSSPFKKRGEQTHDRYYEELTRILDLVEEGGVIFIHAAADKFDSKSRGTGFVLKNIRDFENDFEELTRGVYRRKVKSKNDN